MLLILAVVSIAGCGTVLAANPQPTPEPAPSASITPSETPAATTPTDTPSVVGPVTAVTATVADRIPASLQGRAWAAVGPTALFAGSLGDPVRLRLPPSWDLLAITDEYVVTGQRALDGSSTLVNFSFRGNGAADRKPVSVPGQMIAGVVASDRLYVTGFDATSTGDPGVIAISMLDGTVTIVVPPAPAPEGLGSPVARNVLVSPSGRTVLSSLCSPAGCSGGTIVDASTASVRGSLANTDGPSAINESFALVRRGGD
ncbi:MAG: hypothetical protein ACRD3J_24390, partial [Thermoanaerobaculia bacterium]